MALDKRDWIIIGVTFGVSALIFTTLGRRSILTLMGAGRAEANRLLSKIEKKVEKRAKV